MFRVVFCREMLGFSQSFLTTMLNSVRKQVIRETSTNGTSIKVVLDNHKGQEGVFLHKSGEFSATVRLKTDHGLLTKVLRFSSLRKEGAPASLPAGVSNGQHRNSVSPMSQLCTTFNTLSEATGSTRVECLMKLSVHKCMALWRN